MKKLKSGFTLAEVLITIAVIGIVATMVMPSVMTNHTYKTMGTKLSKFIAQIEDSARPFVVMNDNFEKDEAGGATSIRGLQEYLEDTFVVTNGDELDVVESNYVLSTVPTGNDKYESLKGEQAGTGKPILHLKDGTSLVAYSVADDGNNGPDQKIIDTDKVGDAVFTLRFSPNISGVPKSAQQSFYFVVTNLGYVFPDQTDACTLDLYQKGFDVKAYDFKKDAACNTNKS